jgi:hypothetical protein
MSEEKQGDDKPQPLPAGGSAAEERLREAEATTGRAPSREGANPKREDVSEPAKPSA